MTIRSWLLPESINLRLTAFFDDLRKARRFYFKKLHSSGFVSNGAHGVTRPTEQKKSARELRQGGSDYRCCIPALAGFVSPQSIAPDGDKLFAKECRRANGVLLGAESPLAGRESVEPNVGSGLSAAMGKQRRDAKVPPTLLLQRQRATRFLTSPGGSTESRPTETRAPGVWAGDRLYYESPSRLREGHVRLDPIRVGLVDFGRFGHVPLALATLRGKQMPPGSMLTHDLARSGDLEPFRDCFSSFVARYRFRHKARKIAAVLPSDKRFCAPGRRRPAGEQSSRFRFLT